VATDNSQLKVYRYVAQPRVPVLHEAAILSLQLQMGNPSLP